MKPHSMQCGFIRNIVVKLYIGGVMDYRRLFEDVALLKTTMNTESISNSLDQLVKIQADIQEKDRQETAEEAINRIKTVLQTFENTITQSINSISSADNAFAPIFMTQMYITDIINGVALKSYEYQHNQFTYAIINALNKTMASNSMVYDFIVTTKLCDSMVSYGESKTFADISPGVLIDKVTKVFNSINENKYCMEFLNSNTKKLAMFMILIKSILIKLMYYQKSESSTASAEYKKVLQDGINTFILEIGKHMEMIKSSSIDDIYTVEETFPTRRLTRYENEIVITKSFSHALKEEMVTIKTSIIDRPVAVAYYLAFSQSTETEQKKKYFELLLSFLHTLKYSSHNFDKFNTYEEYYKECVAPEDKSENKSGSGCLIPIIIACGFIGASFLLLLIK